MVQANEGQQARNQGTQLRRKWRTRFVSYVKRKLYQRKRKKEEETPTDKAGRRTAAATVWMAIFTLFLILVGGGTYFILKNQLHEMKSGGTDTHDLALAAKEQAIAAKALAVAAGQQADRTKDLADRMKDQADRTKVIAEQAVIQATAASNQVSKLDALGVATIAQNKVLSDQLAAMQNGQIVQERPWVKVSHRIIAPLTFDVEGRVGSPIAMMTIEDTIENVGQTVALNMLFWEDIIPRDADATTRTATARQDEWCDANRNSDQTRRIGLN